MGVQWPSNDDQRPARDTGARERILTQLIGVVGLALVGFLSTSLDNLLLLAGFFADDEYPPGKVLGGYLTSVAAVVLSAFVVAEAVELVPASYLGYLGLVPVTLGLHGLYRLISDQTPAEQETPRPGKGFLPVCIVMLANSGDSLAVFTSLFADTAESLELPIVVTILGSALGFATLVWWVTTRGGHAARIRPVGRVVLPFLLIGIGAYILLNTGTDAAL